MLIGLSGYAQVGKDSAAEILSAWDFERRAFADILREALIALNPTVKYKGDPFPVANLFKWHGYDKARQGAPEIRDLLQRLGTEVGRNLLGENVWVDAALATCDPDQDYVFTDCRFVNEADALRALGGIIVRIERPGYGPVNGHPSETAMDDYPWDYVVINDGDYSAFATKLSNIVADLSARVF